MAERNDIITEIQKVIQQIKTEYREGVDFKITVNGVEENEYPVWIRVKSLQLKKYCREKFSLPPLVGGLFLHHYRGNSGHEWFSYMTGGDADGKDTDVLVVNKRMKPKKNETEKCKKCSQLVAEKEGWIEQWDGSKKIGGPFPNIIAYFHPACAKKYFAEKEQPNENNIRIKEKLLRNLDKLCLDPNGYLANNEYLKTDRAEEEYQKTFNLPFQKDWKNRYLKIVIDGEEIDLEDWDNSCPEYYEVKRELIKKIRSEIKQNPSEWKIEKGKNENYAVESNNRLIKHVSGRRHWKLAISYLWGGDNSERIKHWTEIEALINGSVVPKFNDKDKNNQINDTEKEKIRQYFLKNDIKEIRLEKNKLIITHNNNETKSSQQIFNNPVLLDYLQRVEGNKITKQSLEISADNASNSNNPNKNNHQTSPYILAPIVILVGIFVYLVRRKKIK